MSEIFIINEKLELIPQREEAYDSEDLLQSLIANYPHLLAGDQIDPDQPRRWLLIKREAEIPDDDGAAGRWSLDHLFLDQEGIPTLVEVKRNTDTRIRREVVGQMLDYAANGVKYWPIEKLRSFLDATCEEDDRTATDTLAQFLSEDDSEDRFWSRVKTNLQAGKIRMLFVADAIPPELQRVIEFLNEQMDPAEVLGLEIKQFAGKGQRTLVPRIIGKTSDADDRKDTAREKFQWDEASFLKKVESLNSFQAATVAKRLIDWSLGRGSNIWWGNSESATFVPVIDIVNEKPFQLFWVSSGRRPGRGRIEFTFNWWKRRMSFENREKRIELLNLFNRIPNVNFTDERCDGSPAIPLVNLASEESFELFTQAMDAVLRTAKSGPPTP